VGYGRRLDRRVAPPLDGALRPLRQLELVYAARLTGAGLLTASAMIAVSSRIVAIASATVACS
jgi:hypothetical protein